MSNKQSSSQLSINLKVLETTLANLLSEKTFLDDLIEKHSYAIAELSKIEKYENQDSKVNRMPKKSSRSKEITGSKN